MMEGVEEVLRELFVEQARAPECQSMRDVSEVWKPCTCEGQF